MKRTALLLLVICLAPGLAELNAATYLEGRVASLHAVPCAQMKIHKGRAEALCEQYVIRTGAMTYKIRQVAPKKVNLLPVGQVIYFRVKQNRMHVKGYTLNGKEIKSHDYIVVSEHQRSGVAAPGM
jgi:hypothetical protein